jgi:hypothetical protein
VKKLNACEVSPAFDQLIDQVINTNQPVLIRGHQKNVVLISEDLWTLVQKHSTRFNFEDEKVLEVGARRSSMGKIPNAKTIAAIRELERRKS